MISELPEAEPGAPGPGRPETPLQAEVGEPHGGEPHVEETALEDAGVGGQHVDESLTEESLAEEPHADLDVRIGQFLAGSPVMTSDMFNQIGEARRLLAQAQAQHEAIVTQAHEQADAIRAEAHDAVQLELEKGYEAGLEEGRRAQADAVAQDGVLQARTLTDMDERIGLMVTRTLNKILTEQQHDERFFMAVVNRVLRAAREEKFLRMRVSSDQVSAAQAAVEQVLHETGAPNLIEVTGDPGLQSGACLVESPHGVIDASLDTQLESIRQALTAVWRSPGTAPTS